MGTILNLEFIGCFFLLGISGVKKKQQTGHDKHSENWDKEEKNSSRNCPPKYFIYLFIYLWINK